MALDFTYGSRAGAVTLLSAELDALANEALTVFGPLTMPWGVTNPPVRHMRGDLSLKISRNSLKFTKASRVIVYFVPAIDGYSFPKLSGSNLARSNYRAAEIALYPATAEDEDIYESVCDVFIPNAPFKTVLENLSGAAFPANGSTLDLYLQAFAY